MTRLLADVIEQSVRDHRRGDLLATLWIFEGTPRPRLGFTAVAEAVGIDPDAIRDRLWREVRQGAA